MTHTNQGCDYFPGTKMTQRGPETLSRFYGFESAQALADSLPDDASVLDAGAGASTFGHGIAGLRPDVRWINLDVGYHDSSVLAELQEGAPENLTFLPGSVTRVDELLPDESLDRVFSFWSLNYLSTQWARASVVKLTRATQPAGELALGRLWIRNPEDPRFKAHTIRFAKTPFPGAIASHVARALSRSRHPLESVQYTAIKGDHSRD